MLKFYNDDDLGKYLSVEMESKTNEEIIASSKGEFANTITKILREAIE